MESLLEHATRVASTADLEGFLSQFGTSEWFEQHSCEGYRTKSVDKVLQNLLDDDKIVTNAKIKRRLKRFIETIEGKLVTNTTTPTHFSGTGTLDEITQTICASYNSKEIEYCINSIRINEVMQNEGDKLKLKHVLQDLIQYKEQYTNKLLRRRIAKLVYGLSSKDDQTKIKTEKKSKQETVAAASKVTGSKRKLDSVSIPIPAPTAVKPTKHIEVDSGVTFTSFIDLVKLLESAKDSTDIENSLKNVSVIASGGQDDYGAQQRIIELFRSPGSRIVSIVMNSKLRRKVDRLVEALQENVKKKEQESEQIKSKSAGSPNSFNL